MTLDTGGTTKGLLADSVAHALDGFAAFVVDCGGDMRVGATRTVNVADPVDPDHLAATLDITNGAVATSGIGRRHWKAPDGRIAHHILDPSTGEPAWTGLVSATALAPTALEAEARAKAAFLGGPAGAHSHLHPNGGVLVHESGRIEHVTPIQERIAA
jgi:thiamine biosynthesis lipoprotein